MPADLRPGRFINELKSLDVDFTPSEGSLDETPVPAIRPVLEALMLYNHTAGYRLFTYDVFEKALRAAYRRRDEKYARKKPCSPMFEHEAFLRRLKAMYESAMIEAFVYLCLVDALEDKMKIGLVFYDVRHDFKQKYDAAAFVKGKLYMINMYRGSAGSRTATELRRADVERVTKMNTMESSHWGNAERLKGDRIELPCESADEIAVRGVRLFSANAINKLLRTVYDRADIASGDRFFYLDDNYRDQPNWKPRTFTKN